ncbi:hypothetical protein DM02DRAFT_622377 [Periconia macrospinosa]|uniref:Uncharacterized protein n=1 Tax=Periconia macrospinosa TaxID=97972 RepID=A0A2V1E9Z6_9PLEO|nr:hypothetical protein DM02DRAFT_622377 [Periconia macrospinosa]
MDSRGSRHTVVARRWSLVTRSPWGGGVGSGGGAGRRRMVERAWWREGGREEESSRYLCLRASLEGDRGEVRGSGSGGEEVGVGRVKGRAGAVGQDKARTGKSRSRSDRAVCAWAARTNASRASSAPPNVPVNLSSKPAPEQCSACEQRVASQFTALAPFWVARMRPPSSVRAHRGPCVPARTLVTTSGFKPPSSTPFRLAKMARLFAFLAPYRGPLHRVGVGLCCGHG